MRNGLSDRIGSTHWSTRLPGSDLIAPNHEPFLMLQKTLLASDIGRPVRQSKYPASIPFHPTAALPHPTRATSAGASKVGRALAIWRNGKRLSFTE